MQPDKTPENLVSEERSNKLAKVLPSFLLINPQSESAMINLQKLIEELDDETADRIYEMAKKDLTARVKRQIAQLREQIERM